MFIYKTLEELSKMSVNEQQEYQNDVRKHEQEKADKVAKTIDDLKADKADSSIVKALEEKHAEMLKEIENISGDLKAMKESGNKGAGKETIKKLLTDNSEVLKQIKAGNKAEVSFEVTKAMQNASDIDSGSDYAMMIPGTIRKPVRRPRLVDLFRRRPVSTEYIKYREENVVTRDAKFVVACATSEHNTKKTWIVRTVQLAKIRDLIDVCIDMMDDYDFVEGEIYQLINESIDLKLEAELLLGASTNPTDLLSIDSISSVFNPANPLADFSNAFEDANLEQLIDAMAGQIAVFGQLNAWSADTVVMNHVDFIKYRNLKDANGNKIIHTVSENTATGLETRFYIAGLEVVTSPLVPQNELYVFDSTKGLIFDRMRKEVSISYENNDNFEHEVATIKGVQRVQFYVSNIDQDAFMKVEDIEAAIAAISKT